LIASLAGRRLGRGAVALLAASVLLLSGPTHASDRSAAARRLVSVIVQGLNPATARDAVERHGGTVTDELPIIDAVGARVPADAVAAVQGEAGVRAVTPNAAVHVQSAKPKPPPNKEPAGITPAHPPTAVYRSVLGADLLGIEGTDGQGVTVAVVDTGIADVPDLAGRVIDGIDFTGDHDYRLDGFGHGSFVAGIVAGDGTSSHGKYVGVAPGADLVSLKIAGADGASNIVEVIKALQAAIAMKTAHPEYNLRVLNLSLGTDSKTTYLLSPLDQAVEEVWNAGIVVVVSSSNLGQQGAGTVTKPADDPLVVTVGAIDDLGTATRTDDVMAGFSGKGPTQDGFHKPDVVASGRSLVSLRAPGSAIDTRYPKSRVGASYFRGSGTSFSTAVASGAAALVLESNPLLSPDQVKARLMDTAVPLSPHDADVDGAGSVDAYGAAHSVSLRAANAGVLPSVGGATLADDCGSVCVQVHTDGVDALGNLVTVDLTDPDWAGSSWWGSSWWDSTWTGSSWWGSSWWGSSWWGERWYGAWE